MEKLEYDIIEVMQSPDFYTYTYSYPPEMGGHVFYVGEGSGG